jgi:hypothetical protein
MGESIIRWLTDQMQKVEQGGKVIFRLRYVERARTATIDTWTMMNPFDASALAHEIMDKAELDSRFMAVGGGKKYELQAIRNGENVARYPIEIHHGENEEDFDKLAVANGTVNEATVALLQQSHSHVEVLVRALVSIAMGNEKHRLVELERMARRNLLLEERVDGARETVERAQDKQFERDMSRKKYDDEQRRLNEAFATGRTLLPFAINAVAKKNLVPTGDNSVLKEALRPVFSEITTDQLEKLQSIFSPTQVVGLLEVWKLLEAEGVKMPKMEGEKANGKHNA